VALQWKAQFYKVLQPLIL